MALPPFPYDVFISFRGVDTRHGFAGYLWKALDDKGIRTFIDDMEHVRDELFKILECNKAKGLVVLPVFYEVKPSDVRKLTGTYGEAMAMHEERFANNKERVQNWKKALCQAADLLGWHFKHGDGYEYKLIERIVEVVSNKINFFPLPVVDHLVGLDFRMHNNKDIQKILELSFGNALEKEKHGVLHIPCCFKGCESIIPWAHHGVHLKVDIEELVKKSLIKINHGEVALHDKGREIVKCSRVWFCADIIHGSEENKGTSKTQVIILQFPIIKEEAQEWNEETLEKLQDLKTLFFSKGPKHLPNSLNFKALKSARSPSQSLQHLIFIQRNMLYSS